GSFGGEGENWLLLDPVAADALPVLVQPCRITPAVANANWTLVANAITRVNATSARVDLRQAQLLTDAPEPGAAAVHVTDLLVLVVPGGLHGGSNYIFPVQRIGADVCEIRSSVALD